MGQREYQRKMLAKQLDNIPKIRLHCTAPNCGHPVGYLSTRYCRMHIKRHFQYGSAWAGDYPGTLTTPALKAARYWLWNHEHTKWVRGIRRGIQGRIDNGPPVRPWGKAWKGQKPRERVRLFWGHLKAEGVTADQIIEAWLVAEICFRQHTDRSANYRLAQIGRRVHRLAAKSWPVIKTKRFITLPNGDPGIIPWEDRRRQRPWGVFARALGKEIDGLCNYLLDRCDLLEEGGGDKKSPE